MLSIAHNAVHNGQRQGWDGQTSPTMLSTMDKDKAEMDSHCLQCCPQWTKTKPRWTAIAHNAVHNGQRQGRDGQPLPTMLSTMDKDKARDGQSLPTMLSTMDKNKAEIDSHCPQCCPQWIKTRLRWKAIAHNAVHNGQRQGWDRQPLNTMLSTMDKDKAEMDSHCPQCCPQRTKTRLRWTDIAHNAVHNGQRQGWDGQPLPTMLSTMDKDKAEMDSHCPQCCPQWKKTRLRWTAIALNAVHNGQRQGRDGQPLSTMLSTIDKDKAEMQACQIFGRSTLMWYV